MVQQIVQVELLLSWGFDNSDSICPNQKNIGFRWVGVGVSVCGGVGGRMDVVGDIGSGVHSIVDSGGGGVILIVVMVVVMVTVVVV